MPDLISRMIQTERSRRGLPADRALAEVRERLQNPIGHSSYPILIDQACAAEYEERANKWLQIARRVVDELDLPWSEETGQAVGHLLRQALADDWNEIYTRAERATKAARLGPQSVRMEEAKGRSAIHLDAEIALLTLREDRTRLPLAPMLAADRYKAVGDGWEKARQLRREGADHANAVKEAVGAVEALARIVTAKPTATLGQAVASLRSSGRIRAPLLNPLDEIYGWASGEPGVRHSAQERPPDPAEVAYCFTIAEAALRLLLAADAK